VLGARILAEIGDDRHRFTIARASTAGEHLPEQGDRLVQLKHGHVAGG
jgi:hypothetical protein